MSEPASSAPADAAPTDAARAESVRAESVRVEVETKSDTFAFECPPSLTLLAAGLAAGYTLPYGCATGTCGTCRARVMEGEVDPGWTEAPGYRRLKRDKGDVLLCQARPRSACDLRIPMTAEQPKSPAPLAMDRKGRVTAVRKLTPDVVELDVEISKPMDYAAGQFVTVAHGGVAGPRAYSMVKHGAGLASLTLLIKRKPEGRFSQFLFVDEAIHGAELDIVGPLGTATFRPDEDRDFLCVAGGSGIAGMMAMLDHATAERYFGRRRGHVFFGVRRLADAFYLDELARHVAAADGALDVTLALSDETDVPAHHPDFPDIALGKGFVHEVAAAALAAHGEWDNATAYVAGPQPMVDATLQVLIGQAGLNPQSIRLDKHS